MRKTLILATALMATTYFDTTSACPQATSTNTPGFCTSFKLAAICHCTESKLPLAMCSNMQLLYDLMIVRYGSVQRACAAQHDTSTQACLDDWQCYRQGGTTSKNETCNATGAACV